MPEQDRSRERDLILAPNEYAFLLDETKGNIINYVGPHKTSLANTDQPVTFNDHTKRFERCLLEKAIQAFAIAPEGWYIVLKNPSRDGRHAKTGTPNILPDLDIGRKINMPGPVAFAPWPGQMIKIIQGHHLRSNQYLIVRVYDEESAKANWGKAVIKPQTVPGSVESVEVLPQSDVPELTMGRLLVIKGTEVAFYIPPTGIEVVADINGHYVREAVTLERLEYCILLDENGNKRYIQGPDVVFPKPTEIFILRNENKKFKAVELNEISGLYIKVIAPYEEGNKKYKVGDELFITGKEQMIYFPRPEHAVVRYGDRDIHFAIAIPAGEARYLMDRFTGQIILKKGPCMLLPDPRKEIIVRRILDVKLVELWFPGNPEALEYNRRLVQLANQGRYEKQQTAETETKELQERTGKLPLQKDMPLKEGVIADEFARKQTFSQPRTITLDTKYEGAVTINVWTGYAIQVVSKTGSRKVIVGPQTYLLEYDETLETIQFSTGTPKNDSRLEKSVYLRVLYNKVSDLVEAETRDLCKVYVRISLRVNFEGDPNIWFNVENYVKFLTDHIRSLMRFAVKQYGVEEFYAQSIRIIRDTILGAQDDAKSRKGRVFTENGMRIYDVEILDVRIGDETINELLFDAQHTSVQQTMHLAGERKNLEVTEQEEVIKQKIAEVKSATQKLMLDLQIEETQKTMNLDLARVTADSGIQKRKLEDKLAEQEPLNKITQEEQTRTRAQNELNLELSQKQLEQHLLELKAEVAATVDKAQAVSPQLVAALQAFSDRALAGKMAETMAPLAILGGKSVAEVFANLLKGTVLEKALTVFGSKSGKDGE